MGFLTHMPSAGKLMLRACSWRRGFTEGINRCGRRNFSSTITSGNVDKPPLWVVDLRASGWSLLERLCVEEFLSPKRDVSWLIIGMHEATQHRHLKIKQAAPDYVRKSILESDDLVMGDGTYNASCAVIAQKRKEPDPYLGLNISNMERDGVLMLEPPSTTAFVGGPVILNHASMLTTLLAASKDQSTVDFMTEKLWSPTFQRLEKVRSPSNKHLSPLTMVMDTKSCSKGDNSGRMIRLEDLGVPTRGADDEKQAPKEVKGPLVFQPPNQYCLGTSPVGMAYADSDNQAVRSVLFWDFCDEDHESYYQDQPQFSKLQDVYPKQPSSKVFDELLASCHDHFSVQNILKARDVNSLMAVEKTGLHEWWNHRSKWTIVQGF